MRCASFFISTMPHYHYTMRLEGEQSVTYHLTHAINVLERLLSHVDIKTELTSYLALKTMNGVQTIGKPIVVP